MEPAQRHRPSGVLTAPAPAASGPEPAAGPRVRLAGNAPATLLTGLAALAAAGAATVAGLSFAAGDRVGAVVPLAAVLGLAVAVLAMTRFAGYVLLMLAVRPCLDLFKVSGPVAGRADGAGAIRALDPSTLVAVLFLLATGLWLAAQHCRYGRLRGSPLGWAMLLVGVTGLISAFGAAEPVSSLLEALRVLTIVAMFVVLEQLVPDRLAVRRLLLACYASLALALGYTVLMTLLGDPPAEVKGSFTRISGPFSQSTTFGRYLMFMVIFGCAIYRYLGRRARLGLAVLLGPALVFLLLTNTRSAILGAAIGLIVVAVLQRSLRMLVALGLAGAVGIALVPAVGERFALLAEERAVGGGPTGNTLEWRFGYWTEVLTLANQNPVTGIGPNMTQRQTDEAKKPHNDFLRAYVETGVVGLLAYLALVVLMIRTGLVALRRAPPRGFARGVAIGFLGCAIAFVAVSAVSNVISNVVTLWYLVAFAAVAGAVCRPAPRPAVAAAAGGSAGGPGRPVEHV